MSSFIDTHFPIARHSADSLPMSRIVFYRAPTGGHCIEVAFQEILHHA